MLVYFRKCIIAGFFGRCAGYKKRTLGKIIPRVLSKAIVWSEDDGTRTRNIRLDRPVL